VVRRDLTRGARRLAEAFKIERQVAKSAAEFSLGYKTDRAAAGLRSGSPLWRGCTLKPDSGGVQPNKRLKLPGGDRFN